jgi:hypothetical protein
MVEQSDITGSTKQELNLSFLKELPEDQLMDINGAAHLINHFWDHRQIPDLDLNEIATVLKSNENQVVIAKRIIGELEKIGGCPFINLPEDLINEEIVLVSAVWSKKFEEVMDRKSPNWRQTAQNIFKVD